MTIDIKEFKDQALFGLIDGLNGAVGLIIGLLSSHVSSSIIAVALLARAGSSSVSMAGAQYEADETCDKHVMRKRVIAMYLGYLTSAILPGLGFVISLQFGKIIFVPITIILLLVISRFRSKRVGWYRSIRTTLIIFTLAVTFGLLATFIAGNK